MNSLQLEPEDKTYCSGSESEDSSNASGDGMTDIDQTDSQLEHVS